MPILSKGGAIIGVTQCLNKRGGGRFSREDEAICTALCSLFSVCVLNASVFEREKQLVRRLEALLEVSHRPSLDASPHDHLMIGACTSHDPPIVSASSRWRTASRSTRSSRAAAAPTPSSRGNA